MKQKILPVLKILSFVFLFVAIVFLNVTLFDWIDDLFGQELILLENKLETQIQQLGNEFELALLSLPVFVKIAYIESQDLEAQLEPIITNWIQRDFNPNIFSNMYITSLDTSADIRIFENGTFKTFQYKKLTDFIQNLPDEVNLRDTTANNIYYTYDENSMFLFFSLKGQSTPYVFICEVDLDVLKKDIIPSAAHKYFPLEYGYEIRIRDTRTKINSIVYSNSEVYDPSIFDNPDMIWYFGGSNVQSGATNIGEIEFLWNIPTRRTNSKPGNLVESLAKNLPFDVNSNEFGWRQPQRALTALGYGVDFGGLFEIAVSHKFGSQIKAALAVTQVIIVITVCTVLLLIIGILIIYASLQKNRQFAQHQQEFIDTVTHELKTPISTISILSQNIIKGSVKTPEKFVEYGARIRSESLRLKKTVEYFMLYSKLRHDVAHQLELCNLSDIVCDVYTQYSLQFEQEDFTVEIDVPEQELYINANPYAIELVIRNLLENALKYAKDGRYVSIKLYLIIEQTGKKLVMLEITDNGIGIPLNEQKKVFDYFSRGEDALQKQVQGSGIGLYLVKGIVEFHGGTVSLKSNPKTGSTFILSFLSAE